MTIIQTPYTLALFKDAPFKINFITYDEAFEACKSEVSIDPLILDDLHFRVPDACLEQLSRTGGTLLTKTPESYSHLPHLKCVNVFRPRSIILSEITGTRRSLNVITSIGDWQERTWYDMLRCNLLELLPKDGYVLVDFRPSAQLFASNDAMTLWAFDQRLKPIEAFLKPFGPYGGQLLTIKPTLSEYVALTRSYIIDLLEIYRKEYHVYFLCKALTLPSELEVFKQADQIFSYEHPTDKSAPYSYDTLTQTLNREVQRLECIY